MMKGLAFLTGINILTDMIKNLIINLVVYFLISIFAVSANNRADSIAAAFESKITHYQNSGKLDSAIFGSLNLLDFSKYNNLQPGVLKIKG